MSTCLTALFVGQIVLNTGREAGDLRDLLGALYEEVLVSEGEGYKGVEGGAGLGGGQCIQAAEYRLLPSSAHGCQFPRAHCQLQQGHSSPAGSALLGYCSHGI
jgi:hypothetical protein